MGNHVCPCVITPHSTYVEMSVLIVMHNVPVVMVNCSLSTQSIVAWTLHPPPANNVVLSLEMDIVTLAEHWI